MPEQALRLGWLLAAVLLLRLGLAAWLPLADMTEARYAEISRLMAVSGDWITPWFQEGVPFWGKPPLSFWLQALSFRALGVSELAGRLPSWLASLVVVWLIVRLGNAVPGRTPAPQRGQWPALIYSSMALGFISAGSVMTDAYLTLATTLVIGSLILRLQGGDERWGWLFFIGLAIGLLAKGPLTLVLTGTPVFFWVLFSGRWRTLWTVLPWLRGSALLVLLVLPWYVLAEWKTPGFLDYFIVGEHFNRFLVTDWQGDLYGNAHDYPRGTIWYYLLLASLPWGVLALAALGWRLWRKRQQPQRPLWLAAPDQSLLLLAGLTPAVFFTFSGNVLWTYVLPGLPFLALLIARLLPLPASGRLRLPVLGAVLVPLLALLVAGWLTLNPRQLNSEKALLSYIGQQPALQALPLYYVDEVPFSAHFYSQRRARVVNREQLQQWLAGDLPADTLVAVRKRNHRLLAQLGQQTQRLNDSNSYVLFRLRPASVTAADVPGA